MADSKLPVINLAPVRNRFPTEALWKLKTEVGRARFTISRLMLLRKLRISSRFSDEIPDQRRCRASTISSHSSRAAAESDERRWLKKVLTAAVSGESGMRRTSRPMCS